MTLPASNDLRKIVLVLMSCLLFLFSFSFYTSTARLQSPDKRISFEFEIRNGLPGYRVLYEGKLMVDFSVLNLVFDGDSLVQGVRLDKSNIMDSVERYSLLTGRSSQVNDAYRQLSLYLTELKSPYRKIQIQIRHSTMVLHSVMFFPAQKEIL